MCCCPYKNRFEILKLVFFKPKNPNPSVIDHWYHGLAERAYESYRLVIIESKISVWFSDWYHNCLSFIKEDFPREPDSVEYVENNFQTILRKMGQELIAYAVWTSCGLIKFIEGI